MSRAEDLFDKIIYFGEDAIDEFIINFKTEELFLDFKLVASQFNKSNLYMHKDDRKNLAKAISGFGNSEGGVIIWGVECSRDVEIGDVAKAKVKVKNVYRYLSWIENAISGCTIPSHNKVRNHVFGVDENGDGFLATFIPKSDLAPLMTSTGNKIYIRSGSNNVPAPYSVIAGMFGRAPQPNIELQIDNKNIEVIENSQIDILHPQSIENPHLEYIKVSFSISAKNESNVLAKDFYVSCNTEADGGEYNKFRFFNFGHWDSIPAVNGQLNLVSKPDFKLPPRGIIKCLDIDLIFAPDASDDFLLNGVMGADGTAPKDFRVFITKNKLRSFVAQGLKAENKEALIKEFFEEYFRYAS
ncbi:MAG: ATP-binding protein [Alphaproteobacteria bacterium]